jgi:hypothetical protein
MLKVGSCVRALGAVLVLSASLGACVVYPEEGGYSGYYVGGVVAVAPPEPRVEVYSAPPTVGYVWIGGYWNWVGGRHVWVGGHWEAPRSGYRWVPHRWVHERDGYHLARGHWARR